jgi:hypothetical protein
MKMQQRRQQPAFLWLLRLLHVARGECSIHSPILHMKLGR